MALDSTPVETTTIIAIMDRAMNMVEDTTMTHREIDTDVVIAVNGHPSTRGTINFDLALFSPKALGVLFWTQPRRHKGLLD
jgi:hypothetical protein